MSFKSIINKILGIKPEEIIFEKVKQAKENPIACSCALSPENTGLSVKDFKEGVVTLGNKINWQYIGDCKIRVFF